MGKLHTILSKNAARTSVCYNIGLEICRATEIEEEEISLSPEAKRRQ